MYVQLADASIQSGKNDHDERIFSASETASYTECMHTASRQHAGQSCALCSWIQRKNRRDSHPDDFLFARRYLSVLWFSLRLLAGGLLLPSLRFFFCSSSWCLPPVPLSNTKRAVAPTPLTNIFCKKEARSGNQLTHPGICYVYVTLLLLTHSPVRTDPIRERQTEAGESVVNEYVRSAKKRESCANQVYFLKSKLFLVIAYEVFEVL